MTTDEMIGDYLRLSKRRAGRSAFIANSHVLIFALSGMAIVTVILTAMAGAVFLIYQSTARSYPPLAEQITVKSTGITRVYDRNGELLGLLSNPSSAIRAPLPLERISPNLIEATVSTEDDGYWTHGGFDVKGLTRAAFSNYISNASNTTGGSTITQQLVKTVYFTTECEDLNGVVQCWAPRTLERKVEEVLLAIRTEGEYSKDEILTWYLNSISYSGRYVGVGAASRGYFKKDAAELSLAEAAVLAGIPAAPTRFNPRNNCLAEQSTGACVLDDQGRTTVAGETKARQEYVLDLMVAHGRLSAEAAAEAKREPVLVYADQTDNRAAAFIDVQVEPRLVRMCRAGLLPMTTGAVDCVQSVHSAGYRVTTSLDWALNSQASSLVNSFVVAGLESGCDCHNASVVTIDPGTGQVIVYVPNVDPTWVSDPRVAGNVDQATEIHQPGSSFKPAVYLAWMDGLAKTPMSVIWDTNPIKLIDKPAKPEDQVTISNPGRNGNASQGLITARAALGGSQNVPAFRAAAEAGIENVISMAKALGITTLQQGFDPTFRYHPGVMYGPSIATGGANIRLIDMAYMNATIANMGVMVGVPALARTLEPQDALSVSDSGGEQLEKALNQREAFLKGHLRLPGTRALDPVVVLKVESADGAVIYEHGEDLVKQPTVNPGSVWMLHSIMSDCTARFLIWQCGTSNNDLSLDFFVNGAKIPGGVKTGTQQTATSAAQTLETWMTGYTRHAASAVWIGNADKTPVRDGPEANYASANATVRLFKTWMGAYHANLQERGEFVVPLGFDDLKPANVKLGPFQSSTTERGGGGGCYSRVQAWQRTDVDYRGGDCLGKSCIELPALKRDLAVALAYARGIPACGLFVPSRPANTATPAASPSSGAQDPGPRDVPTETPRDDRKDPKPTPARPTPKPTEAPKDPKPDSKPSVKPNPNGNR